MKVEEKYIKSDIGNLVIPLAEQAKSFNHVPKFSTAPSNPVDYVPSLRGNRLAFFSVDAERKSQVSLMATRRASKVSLPLKSATEAAMM